MPARKKISPGRPLHRHDCDKCVFLGRYRNDAHTYDLYVCAKDWLDGNEYVARYGVDGEYLSGSDHSLPVPIAGYALNEAWARAKERALARD